MSPEEFLLKRGGEDIDNSYSHRGCEADCPWVASKLSVYHCDRNGMIGGKFHSARKVSGSLVVMPSTSTTWHAFSS